MKVFCELENSWSGDLSALQDTVEIDALYPYSSGELGYGYALLFTDGFYNFFNAVSHGKDKYISNGYICQEVNMSNGNISLQESIGDRIKKLRKELGLTLEKFGERIGRTWLTIQRYESGKRIPDETTLLLISSEFGVSLEWLKTGKGEMWAKKPQAEEVYPVELVAIPVITSVGAGGYIYTPDHVLIERSRLKAKTVVAFKVDGDSMHPTIQKGEFVLVEEEDKEPVDGYIYLLAEGEENGLRVRRLRLINNEWWAFCDNPAYPPEKLTDNVKIIGRVEYTYKPAEIKRV